MRAIFSADVKDCSQLMGDDEETTIHTITRYRPIITGLIVKHEGRVVDWYEVKRGWSNSREEAIQSGMAWLSGEHMASVPDQ